MSADWHSAGFGVYIHWPFCLAKCPYCDFNSHVWREVDHDAWGAALEADLAHQREMTGPRRADTVFLGGGTPSLMEPRVVERLLNAVDRLWELSPDAEITLEANPTSVEAGRFRGYAAAGVNRVSMGVQALNDADLKALGRMHSAAEARAAFDVARAQFARVSFDLIYARPGQSLDAWEAELREAMAMAVDHLSLYQLTIEPGTRFAELHARGKLTVPEGELSADLYALTQEVTASAGMPAYEVSNHARPGAESRHNLIYWRHGDYAGAGPGAHGRITLADGRRVATETFRDPARWLGAVREGGNGLSGVGPLAQEEQAAEYLLMSLRLAEGTDPARYERLGGRFDARRLETCVSEGLLERAGERLRATGAGRMVLNRLLAEISA